MMPPSDSLSQSTNPKAIEPLASPAGSEPMARRQRLPLVPLLLALLALLDLRVELQLLFDHITFTSLTAAIRSHLLAVMVLVFTPSLIRRYRF